MRRLSLYCICFILCSQLFACSVFNDLFQTNDASPVKTSSTSNVQATTPTTGKPKKIFVLLPLQGQYGDSGQAIRNGFMGAFYANKSHKGTPPAIKVIDTSNQNINAAYQQALSQGADLIVGPLDKDQVQTLIKGTSLTVPTLALNAVTDKNIPNLFQFGLSQLDEADQVAQRAFRDGHRRALVIAPAGNWGAGIAARFKSRWQTEGGVVVDQLNYQQSAQLSEKIRQVLHVSPPVGKKSAPVLVRRRQDIDMIFLLAEPARAREIAPLLKFYYAGNLPVYATSSIYSGTKNTTQDSDLDNIQFADMPWVLGGLPNDLASLQQNVSDLWKTSYSRNPKLYALGADAFALSLHLNQIDQNPIQGIRGATGTLYLRDNQKIYRELPWAKMREGNPSLLR